LPIRNDIVVQHAVRLQHLESAFLNHRRSPPACELARVFDVTRPRRAKQVLLAVADAYLDPDVCPVDAARLPLGSACRSFANLTVAATTDLLEDGTPGAPAANDGVMTLFLKD
jgi:hypothetical protein